MSDRSYPDIIAGVIIAVFGTIVAVYAATHYNIGTVRRMGPGMFPTALGVIIGVLGVLLTLTAALRMIPAERIPEINWRAAVLVLTSVVLFSVLINTAGLFPAVIAVIATSAYADKGATVKTTVILSAILSVLAFLIFKFALGMNFKLMEWPF